MNNRSREENMLLKWYPEDEEDRAGEGERRHPASPQSGTTSGMRPFPLSRCNDTPPAAFSHALFQSVKASRKSWSTGATDQSQHSTAFSQMKSHWWEEHCSVSPTHTAAKALEPHANGQDTFGYVSSIICKSNKWILNSDWKKDGKWTCEPDPACPHTHLPMWCLLIFPLCRKWKHCQ